MKKKLLAILFVATVTMLMFAVSVSAATITNKIGECSYTFDDETGVLTISGQGAPARLDTYARQAVSVVFEEGVTKIPDAFCYNNAKLTSVSIPSTVTYIGTNAFQNCTALTDLQIAENCLVETVAKSAFANTGITSVAFNDNLKTVGESAFQSCSALVSVDLGNQVSSIGKQTFEFCYNLLSAKVGGTYTTLPIRAFSKCYKLNEVTISDAVTVISQYAFWETKGLETVNLPSGLVTIEKCAFKSSGIKSLELPATVKTIGEQTFNSCSGLTTINLPEGLTQIGTYCFAASGITSITIPDSLTTIPIKAFANCKALKTVNMNNTLTNLGGYAFYLAGITSIVLPETVTTLGGSAFAECTSLVSAEIKAGPEYIPDKFFSLCTSLKTVVLPETVVNIRPRAFNTCTALESVNIPTGLKLLQIQAFYNTPKLAIDITIPGSVSVVGENCFFKSGITSVTFGEGVTTIGAYAFKQSSITGSVTLPSTVTTVGESAFMNTKLTDAYIPSSVTSFGDNIVFYKAKPYVVLHIEENATYANEWAATAKNVTIGDAYVPEGAECNHNEVVDEAVAATCTATGLTEGKHCDVCGEVLVAQEVVAALGHTEVVDEAVAATCTATGLTEGKHCDICGDVIVAQETVAALGHTEVVDEAVAATCTATGLTEGKHCDVCGEVLVAQEVVAALGHSYGDAVVTEATPWEAGKSVQTCANCGDEIKEEIAFVGSALGLDVVVDGNTATATLQLFNAPELTSVAFSIKYKGADLVLTAANTAITHGYTTDPSIANPVKFVWINGLENVDINGTVATFTFTVNEGSVVDTGDFNISYDADDVCALDEAGELVNVDLAIYVRVN